MRRSNKFYRQNEAEVMDSLGLKPTKNSGAGWVEKEDGQNEFVIAQLKSTDAQSISVKQKDIHTLQYNASVCHKIPIFVIQFLGTGEVYIQMKPEDIAEVAKYLDTGRCDVIKPIISADTPKGKAIHRKIKVIKTGDRSAFYDARQKQLEERVRNVKSQNKNNRKI